MPSGLGGGGLGRRKKNPTSATAKDAAVTDEESESSVSDGEAGKLLQDVYRAPHDGAGGGGGGGGDDEVLRGLTRLVEEAGAGGGGGGKRKQDGGAGAGAGGGGGGGKKAAEKTTKSKSKRVKVARAAGGKGGWEVIKFEAMVYCGPPPAKQAGQWRAGFFHANVERKESPYGVAFEATYTQGIWAKSTDVISATNDLWRIVPMGAFLDELKADVRNAGTRAERESAARGEMLKSAAHKETVRSVRHGYGLQPEL